MSARAEAAGALKIFFSYALEDKAFFDAIQKQLNPLERQGLISGWSNCNVSAGSPWQAIVQQYVMTADIILLLLSPDFVASDYCYSGEMKQAMERHEQGEARVIPVLLRPVDWLALPFGSLKPLPENGKAITLWQSKDSALLEIALGIRKVVGDLASKLRGGSSETSGTSSSSPEKPSLPVFWNVPYPRNPFFTGRESILVAMQQSFPLAETADGSTQALSGLGGIGKTQLAIEYAYRFQEQYQAILWIRADSRADLVEGMLALAHILQLPERKELDQSIVLTAVKRWLQIERRWLLIFDNVEDLHALQDLLPLVHKGHILLTMRSQATGPIAHVLTVEKMDGEEGALLLLRRAKMLTQDAPFDQISPTIQAQAKSISQLIDGLPLALDQAGAYIEEVQKNLQDYLALYRKQRSALLRRRGRFAMNHPDSVLTTLSLALEKVEQANPAALDLLRLCAFLHPDAIPEELLVEGAPDLGPVLQPVVVDPFALDTALEELLRFSLVRRNATARTLSLHRLVQVVVREAMSEQEQKKWAELVVRTVSHVFPEVNFEAWALIQRYLPHAQISLDLIAQWNIENREAVYLLHQVGEYWRERSFYADAEPLFQQALAISERLLGPEDPETATSLLRLAGIYLSLGRYKEAEPLFQRALTIREYALGPDHPDTAQSLNGLAHLYRVQGKPALAKPLHERALSIREHTLGPEHPTTAQSLHNLAVVSSTQGNLAEAESLYQRALTIREHVYGADHPETTSTLTNLARLYHIQGKYNEAETLYQRVIVSRKQLLGEDDPGVATALNNLGLVYRSQGKYKEVEPLYQQALAIRQRVLGAEHPGIAQTLNNLASLYTTLGKYQEAEPLYSQALAIRERVLGPQHPETAQILNNLGNLSRLSGLYSQAEELLMRSLAIREKALGLDHLDVATILNNLALLSIDQQKYAEAVSVLQRALTIREKKLGSEHPDVAQILANLGIVYLEQKQYIQAKSYLQRASIIREQTLGATHPDTAQTLATLANLYAQEQKYAEATLLLQRALPALENALGAEHPLVLSTHDKYRVLKELQRNGEPPNV